MGKVIDTLKGAADVLGSTRAIHEHASYIYSHIPRQNQERKTVELKAYGPKQTVVNEDTLFVGESPLDVRVTSDGEYVRDVRPVNGAWMTLLTFSRPGDYHVTFTSGGEKVVVDITAYSNPAKKPCGCGK